MKITITSIKDKKYEFFFQIIYFIKEMKDRFGFKYDLKYFKFVIKKKNLICERVLNKP